MTNLACRASPCLAWPSQANRTVPAVPNPTKPSQSKPCLPGRTMTRRCPALCRLPNPDQTQLTEPRLSEWSQAMPPLDLTRGWGYRGAAPLGGQRVAAGWAWGPGMSRDTPDRGRAHGSPACGNFSPKTLDDTPGCGYVGPSAPAEEAKKHCTDLTTTDFAARSEGNGVTSLRKKRSQVRILASLHRDVAQW